MSDDQYALLTFLTVLAAAYAASVSAYCLWLAWRLGWLEYIGASAWQGILLLGRFMAEVLVILWQTLVIGVLALTRWVLLTLATIFHWIANTFGDHNHDTR